MSYLKVGAVAAQLGVSEQAVRLWCRTGVLPAYRPAGTRQWLVDPERFEAWLRTRATEEVLDSLGAPYRDDRPDHELLADSVALRRPISPGPNQADARLEDLEVTAGAIRTARSAESRRPRVDAVAPACDG